MINLSYPTRIVFAPGISRDLSAELEQLPAKKFFVVNDRALADLKIVDPIIEGLKKAGREVRG